MDISQLSELNSWWIKRQNINNDPKIKKLEEQVYKWDSNIKHFITLENDVIYTVRGPRQVGKTTLLKIIIRDLLKNEEIKPENVFFWSAERNSAKELNEVIQTYLDWRISSNGDRKYLFIDEICSVKGWEHEIVYFANKGAFENCSIVLTGSHSMDLKRSIELLPGRRGGEDDNPLDKILLPMKFSEFVFLLEPELQLKLMECGLYTKSDRNKAIFEMFEGKLNENFKQLSMYKKILDSLLDIYLLTGGIPATINEYLKTGKISPRLFNVYLQAMVGDLNRFNFKELYFKQIIRETFKSITTPISWNSFTKTTEVSSHNTVQEYITALEELFIANITYRCSIHDRRIHSFMKKVYLMDPFIFHALHGWANNKKDYFTNAKANSLNTEMRSKMIESLVYNHLCRFCYGLNPKDLFDPKDNICYYEDKNKKEVDFLMLYDDKYFPFEVKYQSQIASSDFFPFKAFNKGVLVTKDDLGIYRNYVKIPVSMFILLI